MKVSVYIATSVDGFIARKNGDIDWLMAADILANTEDYGYQEFIKSVDCMVMGRRCMEKVLGFPEWPYEGMRVIVLSSTLETVPSPLKDKIELYSGTPSALVERLQKTGCKRVYVDGGKTIQSFLDEGRVTDLTITKIPILLGEGVPLFGQVKHDIELKHVETTVYPSGFVKSTYQV